MRFQETLGRVQEKLPDVVPPRAAQILLCFDILPQISYDVRHTTEPFHPDSTSVFLPQNLNRGQNHLKCETNKGPECDLILYTS